jgi:hypothetical protein
MSMETKRPGDQSPQGAHETPGAPSEGYEHRDTNTKSLLKYEFSLVIVLVVVFFAMKWTFSYYAKTQPLGPAVSPFESTRVLPPSPRLQPQPRNDLHNYCTAQMQTLNTYGWVDQQNGVARIPIDQAIDLTLAHGLPTRPAAEATAAAPLLIAPEEGIASNGPCSYWTSEEESGKKSNAEK